MYKVFATLIFLFSTHLFASPIDTHVAACFEGDPILKVAGCANALTGDFFIDNDDIVVDGIEPLVITRNYASGRGDEKLCGWQFFPQTKLFLQGKTGKKKKKVSYPTATLAEASGYVFSYSLSGGGDYKLQRPKGVANTARGKIGAKTNLKNQRLTHIAPFTFLLTTPDGTKRTYQKAYDEGIDLCFLLTKEELPNGHERHFIYDEYHRIQRIMTTSAQKNKTYAWCQFSYAAKPSKSANFTLTTSDGKRLEYLFEEHRIGKKDRTFQLAQVHGNCSPTEAYDYCNVGSPLGKLLQTKRQPLGQYCKASYHFANGLNHFQEGKVQALHMPIGNEGSEVATHTFAYSMSRSGQGDEFYYSGKGITTVTTADHSKIFFHYTSDFIPELVEYFSPNGQLEKAIVLNWNSDGELLQKTLLGSDQTPLWKRTYEYDSRGNILIETFSGDLSGAGMWKSYATRYTYDDRDRVIEKSEENGQEERFYYLHNTPLLTAKIRLLGGEIYHRTVYEYDADNILTRVIDDNGLSADSTDLDQVTWRCIEEFEGNPLKPISRTKKVWDAHTSEEEVITKTIYIYEDNQIITRIFDKEDTCISTTQEWYDHSGRVIKSIDPLNNESRFFYDEAGRLIRQAVPGRLEQTFAYDLMSRCILSQEGARINAWEYDIGIERQIDPLGNTTTRTVAHDGRILSEQTPQMINESMEVDSPIFTYEYDAAGKLTHVQYPSGAYKTMMYNAYGDLTQVIFPSGREKSARYHRDGVLSSSVDERGVKCEYHFNPFGLITEKTLLTPEGEILSKWARTYVGPHPQCEINTPADCTNLAYDLCSLRSTATTCCGGHKTTATQAFDPFGRLISYTNGEQTTFYTYDAVGRLIRKERENGVGEEALFNYSYTEGGQLASHFLLKEESPFSEVFEYDDSARLSYYQAPNGKRGKIHYGQVTNALGQQVQEKHFYIDDEEVLCQTFDAKNRIVSEKSSQGTTIYSYAFDGYLAEKQTDQSLTQYDSEGNAICIERDGITAKATFSPAGDRKSLTMPSGITLWFIHDPMGRVIESYSSDGTIHYTYELDVRGNLLFIQDKISGRANKRSYDQRGLLLEETLSNGKIIQFQYDDKGRRTECILPDGSHIFYRWGPEHLKEIRRISKDENFDYSHLFMHYDESGFPTEQRLIDGFGRIEFTLNSALAVVGQHSKGLDQFKPNKPPLHPEDFHRNTPDVEYVYDALGRIIEIGEPYKKTLYTYDALNRRMSKKVLVEYDNEWDVVLHHSFIYDGDQEIGIYDEEDEYLRQLKVCAPFPINTGDHAISYEVESKPYVPVYDLEGNVIDLISLIRRKLMESYTYDESGRDAIVDYWESKLQTSKAKNPWRYGCQRLDEEFGLYYVNGRYYDLNLGQFITPPIDPFDEWADTFKSRGLLQLSWPATPTELPQVGELIRMLAKQAG